MTTDDLLKKRIILKKQYIGLIELEVRALENTLRDIEKNSGTIQEHKEENIDRVRIG